MDLIQFITTYFASKHVIHLTAFLCWSKGDIALLYRSTSYTGIRMAVKTQDHCDLNLSPEGLDHPEGMLLDVDCPHADDVIYQASRTRTFNQRHIWLLLDNSTFNSSKADSTLEKALILPDSDFVWSSTDISVELYRPYFERPMRKKILEISRSSTFYDMTKFWTQRPTQVTRRRDMENITLNACIVITEPEHFTSWDDLSLKHIDTLSKSVHPLILLLGEDLNLRYNFMVSQRYGNLVNGSFTGAVGFLERGEAELAASIMVWRKDRMRIAHYVTETYVLRFPFIFRQPPQSAVTNIFVLPLSNGVWLASFIVFLLVTGFLAITSRYMVAVDPGLTIITAGETITFVIGAICQQGFHCTPKLQSIRILMLFTFITSLFLFTSYSAKIVSILQTPSHSIQTVMELAKSQFTFGVQDVPYKRTFYEESPPPATKYLYETKLRPLGEKAFSYSVVDGVAKMRTGKFAFQVEMSSGIDIIQKTFTESEKCGLYIIDTFRLGKLGIPFKKHSGLKELATVRFGWQRETGLMEHAIHLWVNSKPRCESGRTNDFVSVGIKETLPALQVVVFGTALAVLVLVQECLVYKIGCDFSKVMKKRRFITKNKVCRR